MEMDGKMDGVIRTETIEITQKILKVIAEIDEFKGAWTAIGRISPEQLIALRRVATIESIGSSTRIEGARLSDKDVEALLAGLEIYEFASRDEQEVAGYAETILLLLRGGYGYVPYSSLESVIEQSKDSYYLSLRQTQSTLTGQEPDWQPWLNFFLRALQQQKVRLEKKIERERLILGNLPELSVEILELCRERGRVTVAEAKKVTGANRNTIKDHIKALVCAGHLKKHGAGRGTWYSLS